jgi:plastocyanin
MKHRSMKISIVAMVFSILLVSFTANEVSAESIPEWIKNNALWYGQGDISETEFLNAMKFLIEEGVLIIEIPEPVPTIQEATVTVPNGNSELSSSGFYFPLNLEIPVGITVTWVNDDSVPHNIQSMDKFGSVTNVFNSPPLSTGDRYEFTFEESGVYNYFCSFHPWRVGSVTVS